MKPGFQLKRQCGNCPFRLDAPRGEFPPERYRQLFEKCVVGEGAVMACHHTRPGAEQACVGFLAAEGDALTLPRLARAGGRWSPDALELAPGGQYENFEAMAGANGVAVDRHASGSDKAGLLSALLGVGYVELAPPPRRAKRT